jgi:mono/diheme cytochrome c family protein
MDRPDDIRPADLGIARLLRWFAVLAVALLVALAIAPARAHFTEWRKAQNRYNKLAHQAGLAAIPVSIKQIWKPELAVVDRCPSCHLGMDVGAPLAGAPLYAAHPPVPHEPREMGCTVCHGGQGRATSLAAAHGEPELWRDPMLPRGFEEAGCGGCHSGLKIGSAKLIEAGRKVVEGAKCADCHRVGFEKAPDLSTIGLRGFRADWHAKHIEQSATAKSGLWTTAFAPLADDEVTAVGELLRASAGAPRLMAGKALAYQSGCRGCHRIDGVGGDDGPDLSDEGHKRLADLPFAQVTGPATLANWLEQHFLDPQRVVAKSQMPKLGFTPEQAEQMTMYVLSLRRQTIPEGLAPRDRVRLERLGERDFATDGESLFGVFCAACHGPRGEGRRFQTLTSVFPAIGEPEFLAIADDVFLRKTLMNGRPGRRMPAWGTKDGGLHPEEVDAVITFLRTLEPKAPTADEFNAATADLDKGNHLFAGLCARCHGERGEGSAVAPPLAAPDNPVTGDDSRVYGTVTTGVAGTAMGSFRGLDAGSLRSLVAAVRALPKVEARRTGWAPRVGQAQRGGVTFTNYCAKCHGLNGEGPEAPALANPAFLASATDGYLTATILRGRGPTKMPHFGVAEPEHPKLSPDEVVDVVAFIRTFAR